MIKKIIKKIIYKIYMIGLREHALNKKIELFKQFNINSLIPDSVVYNEKTKIINQTNSRDNIIIGEKCIIHGELLTFQHGGEIIIGKNVFIGEQTKIWSAKSIKIGNHVLISHNVNIHDTISHSLKSDVRKEEYLYLYKYHMPMPNKDLIAEEIVIGDDVWIGFNVTIFKGVKIGNGAIIGANTIITKDVPECTIVVGPDQKIIKHT